MVDTFSRVSKRRFGEVVESEERDNNVPHKGDTLGDDHEVGGEGRGGLTVLGHKDLVVVGS